MARRTATQTWSGLAVGRVHPLARASLLGACLVATGAAGCSGGDKPAPQGPLDPTFSNVYANVINSHNCGGPACHLSASAAGFLVAGKSALYTELVNQPASGPKCAPKMNDGGVFIRVVPGNSAESLVYLKLSHAAPCGDDMPGGLPLDDAKVDLVKRWIEAGAKND